MSRQMSSSTIHAINSALLFTAGGKYEAPRIRPWQYVQMEYERVGLAAPVNVPRFETVEDAQIWMCLDSRYNTRLRECSWQQAV